MGRFTGLLGLVAILGVAWLFSNNKRAIKPRIVACRSSSRCWC
jgi:nucleoside permease NupC